MRFSNVPFVISLLAGTALAQAPARSPFLISRPVPDAAAVERGKTLYVPTCGFCHGPTATGAEVCLDEPALAAPGQACVFYDGDRVLGGGFIRGAADGR